MQQAVTSVNKACCTHAGIVCGRRCLTESRSMAVVSRNAASTHGSLFTMLLRITMHASDPYEQHFLGTGSTDCRSRQCKGCEQVAMSTLPLIKPFEL